MKALDAELLRAAEILEREAGILRDSCAVRRGRGLDWCGETQAKADHDEMLAIARSLRRVVGTL